MPANILFFFGISALLSMMAASILARRLLPGPDEASAARRIGHLDGLRGFLAFSVLLHHSAIYVLSASSGEQWARPEMTLINQLGAGAVALFFMVSGTVFYPLILKGVEADWLSFIIKRAFRILPLVTVSVAMVLLVLIAVTGRAPGREDILPFLSWISSWSQPPLLGIFQARYLNAQVLWSLQWEWLFYFLVLPSCALLRSLLRTKGLTTLFVPALLLMSSVVAGRLEGGQESMTGAKWSNTLPLFAAGMLAFECTRRPSWQSFLGGRQCSVIAGICMIVAAVFSSDAYGWSFPLFAFAFITVACGNSFGGLLKSKSALALGEFSFSVYLLHGLVLWIGFKALAPLVAEGVTGVLLTMPLLAALTVVIAFIANQAVERPSMMAGEQVAAALARFRKSVMVNGLVRLSN